MGGGLTVAVGVDSAGAEVDGCDLLRERDERGDEEHPHLHPARREDRRRDCTSAAQAQRTNRQFTMARATRMSISNLPPSWGPSARP